MSDNLIMDPQGERGFTLLELLVTLALLSMLSLALFGSLRYGTRVWEASRTTQATIEDIRHAQQRLTRLISTAYPEFVVKDAQHASIAFDGEPSSLQLLAPDGTLPGALDEITIRQTASEGLVLEHKLELAGDGTHPTSEILLEGVKDLKFEYFGSLKGGRNPDWQNSWSNKTRPPLLIRVRAVLADRHGFWPELTVAPQILADVSCSVDAVSGYCQGR